MGGRLLFVLCVIALSVGILGWGTIRWGGKAGGEGE